MARKTKERKPAPPVIASMEFSNGETYPLFTRGPRSKRELIAPAGVLAANKTAVTGLDPATFATEAPIERPEVPSLEEEIPEENVDNSILGRFVRFADRVFPDDLGGMIRGTSGWLSNIPGYRQTVGAALGVPLSAGAAVLDALNWGSEQMNHLGAALLSWLPGGIQTLTWEQSKEISFGQVAAANAVINSRQGVGGFLINAATGGAITSALMGIGEDQDPDNVLYSDQFDILDPEMRKEAFESGGMGQLVSGFTDAIWLVGADPGIILGGPVLSVVRRGTKVSKFGGYSNQPLKSAQQIDRFGETTLQQGDLIAELGVDGARASGRITPEGEYLIAAMANKAEGLGNHRWVKESSDKRIAQSLLAETSLERPAEAAALAGAMAGHPRSWEQLRVLNADLYEATAMAFGINPLAPVGSNIDNFATAGIRLTDDQIKLADDIIYERLADRQDLVEDIASAGQLLLRGGARVGPQTARAKNAWRAGASRTALENNPFKKSSSVFTGPNQGHFVYDTIEGVAGSMPLRVVRWVGQGTPTGIVFLKDGGNAANSLDEFGSWLRKSPMDRDVSSRLYNEFALARTVQERKAILTRAEDSMVEAIVAKSGGEITPEAARAAYAGYNSRRSAMFENAAKSENNFFIDPSTNEIIKVPGFYAEVDQAFPLLDVKEFSRVVKANPSFRYLQEGENALDYLNSLWKVSVLARLGYTQRNIAEGALRSFAVLGAVAANPKAWGSIPTNAVYYTMVRRGMRGAKRQQKMLNDAQRNLAETRALLENLRPKGPASLDDTLRAAGESVELAAKEQRLIAEIDRISENLNKTVEAMRVAQSQRNLVGRRENVMSDGVAMRGAFQDAEGTLALKASSADTTTYLTFDGAVARYADRIENSVDFRRLDPEKLTPKQMPQYFAELTIRFNFRYRSDPVGRMILENRPVDEIVGFLKSAQGASYRKSLSTQGRPLRTDQDIRSYVDQQIRRLDSEIPADTGLRQKLLERDVTSAEVSAGFGSRKLPSIVGRVDDGMPSSSGLLQTGKRKLDSFTGTLMRYLGTVPEDKLLRHPFYNRVYQVEQRRMYALVQDRAAQARAAGREAPDMSSELVKSRINRAAHRIALKSTRETMYTIDRLSNAAVMLRFVSPFFPAFENAIRTWGRIVWTNPAIVAEGNILWNIPNNLGWVVDENGNRQGEDGKPIRSSFLRDEGNYIVWPQFVGDFFKKDLGPFTPGEAIRTRQAGANVIFPGNNWWFPGAGPAMQIPTAWFLKGKPEDAEIIKNAIGESVFREVVPMGQVQGDVVDMILPTSIRRFRQLLNGESSDSAFLTTWNQVIEDEYIQAQLENRALTAADMERIKGKAERFWRWQIGAAVAAPVSSSIQSRWQLQRDAWQRLIDDSTIPYQEKVKRFKESFDELESDDPLFGKGDAFMAITRSGSYTETKLRPNLTTWSRITKNPDLVNELYNINPELVGMFGNMGTFDDPYSYAVYGEFTSMRLGPGKVPVRRKLRPDEILRNNQVSDGWAIFRRVKDAAEEKAIQLGYSSLEVDAAKDLKKIVDDAAEDIAARYKAWGEERRIYQDKLPDFILGARKMVENAELLNEDSTIRHLSAYLDMRDEIANLLSDVRDRETRKAIKEVGYAAAFELRQRDIGFADFYDQYLFRDDFRRLR